MYPVVSVQVKDFCGVRVKLIVTCENSSWFGICMLTDKGPPGLAQETKQGCAPQVTLAGSWLSFNLPGFI